MTGHSGCGVKNPRIAPDIVKQAVRFANLKRPRNPESHGAVANYLRRGGLGTTITG
jgi:hypothetical protein